jgi:hypothetical protein
MIDHAVILAGDVHSLPPLNVAQHLFVPTLCLPFLEENGNLNLTVPGLVDANAANLDAYDVAARERATRPPNVARLPSVEIPLVRPSVAETTRGFFVDDPQIPVHILCEHVDTALVG